MAVLCALLLSVLIPAGAEEVVYAGTMVYENGMAQPMLYYSDYLADDYSNADSEILRFTVYV